MLGFSMQILGPLIKKLQANKGIDTRGRVGKVCNFGNSLFAACVSPSLPHSLS